MVTWFTSNQFELSKFLRTKEVVCGIAHISSIYLILFWVLVVNIWTIDSSECIEENGQLVFSMTCRNMEYQLWNQSQQPAADSGMAAMFVN